MTLDINLSDLTPDERRNLEHQLGIGVGARGVVTKNIAGAPIMIVVVSMTSGGPMVTVDSNLTDSATQHMLALLLLEHCRDCENDDLTTDATSRLIRAARRILPVKESGQ